MDCKEISVAPLVDVIICHSKGQPLGDSLGLLSLLPVVLLLITNIADARLVRPGNKCGSIETQEGTRRVIDMTYRCAALHCTHLYCRV